MTITTKLFSTKVAAAALAVAVVMGFAFAFAAPAKAALSESQIQSILSLLSSFGADTSTINNVNASLRGQATTGTGSTGGTTSSSCTFTKDLTVGSRGTDVTCLQNALIAAGHLAAGNNTGYFGALTQAAVAKWQTAAGVTPAAGYFGAKSRAAFNLGGGSTGGTTTPTPAGSGLTVAAGSQPANSLAPQGASRVPFTRFTLTAGNDGDVTVNGVTVQRTGLGADAAFSGIILVDEATGAQLGTAKTLNSNHQTTVGGTFTIPRGTTKTFLVAGNMAASLATHAGEVPQIAVVAINTSATVTGSLPITGAAQTTNATLSVGTITVQTSNAFASNANASKEIGTTAYKTTGLRLTAGSAEDIRLKTIRLNQTGSVSSSDLANVAVVVGGTAYPATVSSDGKYYDAVLGSGVVVAKGNQVEVYVQYDITGSNSSGRTVIFDIDKTTDIFGTGETYGYGVSPSAGSSSVPSSRGTLTITSGTPYVYSNQVTVTGASITEIGKASSIPAQNIAVNVPNQPLGGFSTDLKGEALTVQGITITVGTSSWTTVSSGSGFLTNVTIVNENGSVVAGPIDATSGGASLAFTDSVTFPTGKHTYTVRGKVASGVGNGAVYTLSMNPSSGWTSPKGDVSGNTISLSSNGNFSMNAMTVKAGALALGSATTPATQTITPGGSSVLMYNIQADAAQSGEDVRFSSVPVGLSFATGAVTELTSCQIYDGATSLTSGSNVVNPSGSSSTTQTFTLDNPVTVAKGTIKTLGVRCNVSGNATNAATFQWNVGGPGAAGWSITGASSGTTITGTNAATITGPTFTIGAASIDVATDAGSPGYSVASAGTTDVTGGIYKFRATNEDITLQTIALKLTNTASSSASDLVKASIYDGATKVGEVVFPSGATVATSTLTTPLTLPKDTDKSITVKLDLADIGIGQGVTQSGHLIAVDYAAIEGVGAQSGTTIRLGAGDSTAVAGVRVFKSYPTLALDTLPSTGVADGRLLRFKVTADAKGPIGLTSLDVSVSTTTASVVDINVYGFTDSNYSSPISGVSAGGQLQAAHECVSGTGCVNGTELTVNIQNSSASATVIQIPAGGTRYFEVRGSVSGVASGASVTTKLIGDSAFPAMDAASGEFFLDTAANIATLTGNFIWSPNSTTTSVRADLDWTNGYSIPGLPSSGIIQTRSN